MPDILIRGYSAPARSATCHFNSNAFCDVLGRKVKIPVDYVERPNTCPLVELPPHGDLIDRDALLNRINAYVCGSQDSEFIKNEIIKAMPAIVPAERRKSGE